MDDPNPGTNRPPPPIPKAAPAGFPRPATAPGGVQITCPKCLINVVVTSGLENPRLVQQCHMCQHTLNVRVFSRLTHEPPAKTSSVASSDSDATCQFYPELRAEVVCDECGCFMSEKAAVDWGSKSLCMPCLHNLRENKSKNEYRSETKIWDNRALGLLALLPVSFVTAPIALILLLRFRKEPRGWGPRSSARWWLALFLSLLVMVAWIALVVGFVALVASS